MLKTISLAEAGKNVAANVRRLRTAQGLSSSRLAALMGEQGRPLPATGVIRIEHHQRRVDVDDLVALAEIFSVAPQDLLIAAPPCRACGDKPPSGFTCNVCGAGANNTKRAPGRGADEAGNDETGP